MPLRGHPAKGRDTRKGLEFRMKRNLSFELSTGNRNYTTGASNPRRVGCAHDIRGYPAACRPGAPSPWAQPTLLKAVGACLLPLPSFLAVAAGFSGLHEALAGLKK